MNPELCIKPEAEWPKRLQRTRVMVADGEWSTIVEGFYRQGMIAFLIAEQRVVHEGECLGNGMFGVSEGDIFDPDFDADKFLIASPQMKCRT